MVGRLDKLRLFYELKIVTQPAKIKGLGRLYQFSTSITLMCFPFYETSMHDLLLQLSYLFNKDREMLHNQKNVT